jgi:hypothetical protein
MQTKKKTVCYQLIDNKRFNYLSGGVGENRTPVQTRNKRAFFMFILQLIFDM